MNKIIKILSAAAIASIVLTFTACGENTSSKSEPTTEIQTTAAQSDAATDTEMKTETDLSALHKINTESGDDFAGAWKITDGIGAGLKSFTFEFDGNKKAYLIIDNVGYIGNYAFEEKDGQKTFNTQLLFGLDGSYTYEFSDDKNTVILTNIENKSTTTMEKVEIANCIPSPQENPETDEALLGAWQGESGETVYFDKNGIMYDSFSFQFTFSNYSVQDSTITSTYVMKEETTDTYTYSVDGDKLKLNGDQYIRISADTIGQN